jgi:hypothetical protein
VGTLAGHDSGIEDLVLTGGADDEVRAVALRKGFLRGRDFEPPEFGGIVKRTSSSEISMWTGVSDLPVMMQPS